MLKTMIKDILYEYLSINRGDIEYEILFSIIAHELSRKTSFCLKYELILDYIDVYDDLAKYEYETFADYLEKGFCQICITCLSNNMGDFIKYFLINEVHITDQEYINALIKKMQFKKIWLDDDYRFYLHSQEIDLKIEL